MIEPAASGRAKCRACGEAIAKGEVRLGERLPNPYGEGETTLWFHVVCCAYARPEPFLEALATASQRFERAESLEAEAKRGIEHRRLPRIRGAQRAPSGRARCRSCREPIGKGAWRIPLAYYEEGRFHPSGFVHVRCSGEYFGTTDVVGRVEYFSPELGEDDLSQMMSEAAGADEGSARRRT